MSKATVPPSLAEAREKMMRAIEVVGDASTRRKLKVAAEALVQAALHVAQQDQPQLPLPLSW